MDIDSILEDRGKTHGDFHVASETLFRVKDILRPFMIKNKVPAYRIEAVEAILSKINRIVHGNHNEADHWDDITGYATLGKEDVKNDHEHENNYPYTVRIK